MLSGSVAILRLEEEPPADYRAEFTNITVEATVQLASKGAESSTLIGPAPTMLRSHWSSSYNTALSLVESFVH